MSQSHLHFRPRPIDINHPLPVITDESIIRELDADNIQYGKATGRWNNIRVEAQSAAVDPGVHEVVFTPSYREIKFRSGDTPQHRFQRPASYISYQDKDPEQDTGETEYELDPDDEIFLETLNANMMKRPPGTRDTSTTRPRNSRVKTEPPTYRPILLDTELEQIISYLETETFFKRGEVFNIVHQEALYDTICSVCNEGDFDQENELVMCDGCNVAVHQYCYGITSVPDGPWLCRKCESAGPTVVSALPPSSAPMLFPTTPTRSSNQHSSSSLRSNSFHSPKSSSSSSHHKHIPVIPPESLKSGPATGLEGAPEGVPLGRVPGPACIMCPVKEGAFKRTKDGRGWVHVVCVPRPALVLLSPYYVLAGVCSMDP
eukprot:TRINITY_DN7884_c0_g1_i2.p1 TRINITY_DN7884_c0_g1~~TRINITY_DN7884_c0_g1_i2.p1  ORF type:complete len:374 (-),score=66.25 TRINITY_DN7884_c0_g1_i2:34-1155(-)